MAIFTIGTTSTQFSPEAEDIGYVGSSFDTNSWTGNIDPQSGRKLHVLYAAFANVKYYDSSGNERVEFILGRNGFGSTDKVSNVLGDSLTTSSFSKVRFGFTEASKEALLGDGSIYYVGVYSPSTSGVETTRTSTNIPIFGSGTTYHTVRANNVLVGNGQQYIEFYVYGLPNTGNRPTATVTGTTSVSLSWTASTAPDSRGTPTHYAVRYRVLGSSTWTSLYRTTTSTSKSISGLSPSTTYEFQVAAQNGISAFSGFSTATGTWSTSRTATTESDVVIDPPTFSGSFGNGTVNQYYDDQVTVSGADSITTRSGHSVPPGLNIDSDYRTYYRLYGTPTTAGTYYIKLNATNDGGTTQDPDDGIIINPEPVPDDPVWNTQDHADIYVGDYYDSQVTAINTIGDSTSYSSIFPFEEYGLSLNTTTGRITGTPTQPDSPIQLSTLTFTIVANGVAGTQPASRTFTVDFRFPGRRMTSSSTSTRLTIARKFNGTDWVPIQKGERMTGPATDTPLSGF